MKTVAAILRTIGAPLSLEEIEIPELRAGQVLVEIAYSGVCHTQLSEINGRKGPDKFLPHGLGHEGSGKVVAVGAGVTKVAPGDAVALTWIKGDGADIPGTVYQGHDGPINSGAVITFARHAVASENRVVRIPAEMPLREAALLGCAVCTGAGMVHNNLAVTAGSSAVVFGAGGIGFSSLLALVNARASTRIVVDIQQARLEKARELGATHIIDASNEDPVTAIRAITAGHGVDFAVEAAGRIETMEAAFASVRNGGGTAVMGGNLGAGEQIAIDPFDLIRGKRIIGSWGGGTVPDRDIPRYVEEFLAGRLPLERLIDKEYAFENINAAIDNLPASTVGRAIVAMR